MSASQQMRRERRLARGSSLWNGPRRVARAIRDFHDEQVYIWERIHLANRSVVRQAGPLTWVPTLDGYRLTGGHLRTTAYGARGDRTTGPPA